jgi:hypothetical protein
MSNLSIPTGRSLSSNRRILLALGILLGSIALGYGAYLLCTFFGTAEVRSVAAGSDSSLVWLRKEFHLSDTQFQRIKTLHAVYADKCDLMCQRIMNANAALDAAISRNKQVTPELQQALAEVARTQQECQQAMLAHIYEVSAQMDPDEGARYLQMMKHKVMQPGQASGAAISQ